MNETAVAVRRARRLSIGVMGASGGELSDDVRERCYRLGEAIAGHGAVLITGACPGEGKPKLITVEPIGARSANDLLRLAATLERGSEHPLAAAVVAGAQECGVALGAAEDFRSMTGKGVVGRVDGRQVALGNRRLMEDVGVAPVR